MVFFGRTTGYSNFFIKVERAEYYPLPLDIFRLSSSYLKALQNSSINLIEKFPHKIYKKPKTILYLRSKFTQVSKINSITAIVLVYNRVLSKNVIATIQCFPNAFEIGFCLSPCVEYFCVPHIPPTLDCPFLFHF